MNKIIQEHALYLKDRTKGKCADLSGEDLSRADLHGVNLSYACLRDVNLSNANLDGANLSHTILTGANLCAANLYSADLSEADMCKANLSSAYARKANLIRTNLYCANLRDIDLSSADLMCATLDWTDVSQANFSDTNLEYVSMLHANFYGVNLRGAKLAHSDTYHTFFMSNLCPEGSFIGWKKGCGTLIKLRIPASAKRSNATTYKCRCDKAKVLEILDLETGEALEECYSLYTTDFMYKVGKMVTERDFNNDRWNECTSGIHFFLDRTMAENY